MKVNYQKSIENKYQAILLRSYKTKLDVYLFIECIKKGTLNNVNELDFKNFKITDEFLKLYKDAYKLSNEERLSISSLSMREVDGMIEHYYKENHRIDFFNVYKENFANILSIKNLKTIYSVKPIDRRCNYCGISEGVIAKLKEDKKIYTKRQRGNSLEFDRKEAYKEYEFSNIVLACYWCNNAKSDEFSYTEFIENIAPAIQIVWHERLNNK